MSGTKTIAPQPTECSECRRLKRRLEKIDRTLDELGAPKAEKVDSLTMELSRVGRIKRLAQSETRTVSREDAATIIERKAKALTEEYCRGDTGPGGYVWTNKEAEWQVILLEELAEEMRNVK